MNTEQKLLERIKEEKNRQKAAAKKSKIQNLKNNCYRDRLKIILRLLRSTFF